MSSPTSSSPAASASRDEEFDQRYSFAPCLRWDPHVEEYFAAAYGREHFAQISKALSCPSCYSCIRVNTLRTSTEAIMRKLSDVLNGDELCVQTGEQDVAKEHEMKADIQKCPYPGLDNVLFIRGSGPHELCYRSHPSQSIKEVIVSRKCAEAVLRGAQVYVPGILACSSHVEKGDTVAVSVAIEQFTGDGGWATGITRGTVLQGSHSDPQYQERKGLYIGQGIAMMSRAGIFRVSEGLAVHMAQRVYNLPSFNNVLEGEIFLQNLPSIVTASVLDPQPGERILDMCAAPGGKTTAIAILMKDKGEVIAIDRSHNKVMDIMKLSAEMGLTCIKSFKLDALKSVQPTYKASDLGVADHNTEVDAIAEDQASLRTSADEKLVGESMHICNPSTLRINGSTPESKNYTSKAEIRKSTRRLRNGPGRSNCLGGRVEHSKGFLLNSFDRVLLDAPCSALGLRPRLFAGEETLESLRNHAKYQRRMLDQAVRLVRPGGVLVYSTCTINPGENEALVRYALDTYKFLSLGPQYPRVGGPGIIGSCELFNETHTETWLTESEAKLVQRFDPSSTIDTIGFFIAKFNVGEKEC